MAATRQEVLALLSPSSRARTIVAACTHLTWISSLGTLVAPYLDADGHPTLVVDPDTAEELLTAPLVQSRLTAAPDLGSVMLTGRLEPCRHDDLPESAQKRVVESTCCLDHTDIRILRVAVHHVHLTEAGEETFRRVAIRDYASAAADAVIATGWYASRHLNEDHPGDVVQLASHLTSLPYGQIAAASIDWIDTVGIDLVVLTAEGATTHRVPFKQPIRDVSELAPLLGGHP